MANISNSSSSNNICRRNMVMLASFSNNNSSPTSSTSTIRTVSRRLGLGRTWAILLLNRTGWAAGTGMAQMVACLVWVCPLGRLWARQRAGWAGQESRLRPLLWPVGPARQHRHLSSRAVAEAEAAEEVEEARMAGKAASPTELADTMMEEDIMVSSAGFRPVTYLPDRGWTSGREGMTRTAATSIMGTSLRIISTAYGPD